MIIKVQDYHFDWIWHIMYQPHMEMITLPQGGEVMFLSDETKSIRLDTIKKIKFVAELPIVATKR